MITTAVDAKVSFLEGQVTFLSSILTSRRNCVVFTKKAGWKVGAEGLIAFGAPLLDKVYRFWTGRCWTAGTVAHSCPRASFRLSGFVAPFCFFFFVDADLFRLKRPIVVVYKCLKWAKVDPPSAEKKLLNYLLHWLDWFYWFLTNRTNGVSSFNFRHFRFTLFHFRHLTNIIGRPGGIRTPITRIWSPVL